MNCAKCGYPLKENSAYCSNCGAKINSTENINRDITPNYGNLQNDLADMSPGQDKIVIAIADGSLYEKPDTNSYVLREIERGDKLTLIGKQGNLYQVKKRIGFDAELTGFIEAKLIEEKPITYKIKRIVATLNGAMFTKPDISSAILAQVSEGDKLIILDETPDFYHVKLESNNSITGYIERDLINSRRAVVFANGQMFAAPDITSEAVCEVFRGDILIIIDETEKFYRVKLGSDRTITGYIGKNLINPPEVVKKQTAETPAAAYGVTPVTTYNSQRIYRDDNASFHRRVVNRPGLLSFVGYTFAIIGWIGISVGFLCLVVALFVGCQTSGYGSTIDAISVGIPAVVGGVTLCSGIIFASAGHGVLRGGQTARVFAILLSFLFVPTILLTILFLIGLLNSEASEYFAYCNR